MMKQGRDRMFVWLTKSTLGRMTATFFLSMLPVTELRLGLPFGITLGLEYWQALLSAVLGNLLPAPLIILFIKQIFAWLRHVLPKMDAWLTRLEERAHLKGEKVEKYGMLGLCLLVAIPLPGTGVWTGSLVTALLKLPMKKALPAIVVGVLIAAAIMTGLTFGVIHLL